MKEERSRFLGDFRVPGAPERVQLQQGFPSGSVASSASRSWRARFVPYLPRGVILVFSPKSDSFRLDSKPIRCVLADDHTLLRHGVRRLLEDSSDFSVVGEAADAGEALKQVIQHRPDIVLLDISMPGLSSFEAARLIEGHCTGTRIVFLTMHEDEEYMTQALPSGASGYRV